MNVILNYKNIFKRANSKKFAVPLAIIMVAIILLTVVFIKRKTITVVINGHPEKFSTLQSSVKNALDKRKISIGPKDKIEPALDSKLVDKETITIKRAIDISINVDGKDLSVQSSEENVGLMLTAEGITLKSEDKVKPDKNTTLTEGMKVEVIRVETKTATSSTPVDFKTVIKNNSGLANTQRKTIQEGQNGEKQTVFSVVYENGVEVSRKVVSEKIVKPPVDKVIMQGTYPVMPISRGGDPLPYSKVFKARATAYSPIKGASSTYTASGRRAVRDTEGYSTIAVDPKVIPLGTKLFVENYGFAIAADTGTGVIGNTIDVFFNTYQESVNWAVKYVNVYILK